MRSLFKGRSFTANNMIQQLPPTAFDPALCHSVLLRTLERGLERLNPEGSHGSGLDTAWVRRYLTSMKTTISSKGQIVLPVEFRQMDRIKPGQEFDVERVDRGDYRLVRRAAPRNEGAIDWLLACPYKDFFVPIDSESTDTL
jgi:hypothetical protein